MKANKLVLFCLLALICGISSCKSDDNEKGKEATTYPLITVLGEQTRTGEITMLPNPPHSATGPVLPGVVLGLETGTGAYVLTVDGHWVPDETITIAGVIYSAGDQVEITGTASTTKLAATIDEYTELSIETMKKID